MTTSDLPCICQRCADRHGDQADPRGDELVKLRRLLAAALDWIRANPPPTDWRDCGQRARHEHGALTIRIFDAIRNRGGR